MNMKKTYIKPMNIIESADLMEELMTGSEVQVGGEYDGSKPIEGREALPSSRNVWDDEW